MVARHSPRRQEGRRHLLSSDRRSVSVAAAVRVDLTMLRITHVRAKLEPAVYWTVATRRAFILAAVEPLDASCFPSS